MPESDERRLIELFKETGAAHHRAYQATNGEDADWPLWYAEYLQARLNQILRTALTRSELPCLMVLAQPEHFDGRYGHAVQPVDSYRRESEFFSEHIMGHSLGATDDKLKLFLIEDFP